MIIVVDGEAQVYYVSGEDTWSSICDELEAVYADEGFDRINAYGAEFKISNLQDLEDAILIILTWGNF